MSPAAVPADDRGLLLGDGLFETLLAEAGELADFGRHIGRMTRGCAVLGIAPPDAAEARRLSAAALEENGLTADRAVVRITLTAGSGRGLERPEGRAGRLLCSASPLAAPAGPARLALSAIRRNDTSPASRLKVLSYLDNILARRQARASGADEALLLNTRGELACAAAANLFWIAEGRLYTPAFECGVLDGIMRARVLEAAAALGVQAVEARSGPEALAGAEALFLTNSLIGLREVGWMDGRDLAPHALARALSSRCR